MAKSKIDRQVVVTLVLTKEEAIYLGDLVQNYLGDGGREPDEECAMRHSIFDTLDFLINIK